MIFTPAFLGEREVWWAQLPKLVPKWSWTSGEKCWRKGPKGEKGEQESSEANLCQQHLGGKSKQPRTVQTASLDVAACEEVTQGSRGQGFAHIQSELSRAWKSSDTGTARRLSKKRHRIHVGRIPEPTWMGSAPLSSGKVVLHTLARPEETLSPCALKIMCHSRIIPSTHAPTHNPRSPPGTPWGHPYLLWVPSTPLLSTTALLNCFGAQPLESGALDLFITSWAFHY